MIRASPTPALRIFKSQTPELNSVSAANDDRRSAVPALDEGRQNITVRLQNEPIWRTAGFFQADTVQLRWTASLARPKNARRRPDVSSARGALSSCTSPPAF